MVLAQCERVMMAWLEGLEAVNSLAGPGSKAVHQARMCWARTLVQPTMVSSVRVPKDCQWQKHIGIL
jgi:hypothetical protein